MIVRFPAAALLAAALLATVAASPNASPPAQRIVAMIPSVTEDLFAIGAGPRVVAVSAFTDYPPSAARLPAVVSAGSIDAERIVALHPDLAIGIPAQRTFAAELARAGVRSVLLPDDAYDDIARNLRTIGRLTGHVSEANALIERLQARTAALRRTVRSRARPPTAFVVLGAAPIFTVGRGSYIANLIALAGGRNAADDVTLPYARYSGETLLARQPDVLIVDPAVHLEAVLDRAPWNGLRAVREHRIFTLRDPAILERPGPRYNDGLAWLIAAFAEVPA
ncbi:cobalamin-binding protein [Vulcanimicrobium alpinum]|uniref:Cobalamin-binding protein n=1 Tax=Vulcanimicrobium alpinum TaxID=3016050 RepID=A0AAN1XZN7_UNVUL|nr:helical backbone metal receptor [Vulcanimicrobium alpinum]BDE07162.1 cobalamin-binding protein [Vulcanimicrobium alpinum]